MCRTVNHLGLCNPRSCSLPADSHFQPQLTLCSSCNPAEEPTPRPSTMRASLQQHGTHFKHAPASCHRLPVCSRIFVLPPAAQHTERALHVDAAGWLKYPGEEPSP